MMIYFLGAVVLSALLTAAFLFSAVALRRGGERGRMGPARRPLFFIRHLPDSDEKSAEIEPIRKKA
jgi:hypothetical protein